MKDVGLRESNIRTPGASFSPSKAVECSSVEKVATSFLDSSSTLVVERQAFSRADLFGVHYPNLASVRVCQWSRESKSNINVLLEYHIDESCVRR